MPHRDLTQAPGSFTRHIVEVGCFSPDDRTQSNQAGVIPGFRSDSSRGRQLECPRNPDDIDVLRIETGLATARHGAFKQRAGDQLVVSAYQDRHSPRGTQATGEVGHGVSV